MAQKLAQRLVQTTQSYLYQRGSKYYFRYITPDEHRIKCSWIPKEIRRSLKTNSIDTAVYQIRRRQENIELLRLASSEVELSRLYQALLDGVEINRQWLQMTLHNDVGSLSANRNLYVGKTQRNPAYTIEMYDCLKWLIKHGYLVKESGMKVIPSKRIGETRYTPYIYSVNPDLFNGDIDRKALDAIHYLGMLSYV